MFLDEAGANTALTRLYGRAPRGARLASHAPQGRWRVTTTISAIRLEGVAASFVFEGATDTAAFRVYVERILVPALRPGDVVVLDNLAPHKGAWVAEAVAGAGAEVWYLPPYSPDLNPIEKMWAKVKALLRKAAARTAEGLYEAIAAALRSVTAEDCQGFFASCGYHATPNCKTL